MPRLSLLVGSGELKGGARTPQKNVWNGSVEERQDAPRPLSPYSLTASLSHVGGMAEVILRYKKMRNRSFHTPFNKGTNTPRTYGFYRNGDGVVLPSFSISHYFQRRVRSPKLSAPHYLSYVRSFFLHVHIPTSLRTAFPKHSRPLTIHAAMSCHL